MYVPTIRLMNLFSCLICYALLFLVLLLKCNCTNILHDVTCVDSFWIADCNSHDVCCMRSFYLLMMIINFVHRCF